MLFRCRFTEFAPIDCLPLRPVPRGVFSNPCRSVALTAPVCRRADRYKLAEAVGWVKFFPVVARVALCGVGDLLATNFA